MHLIYNSVHMEMVLLNDFRVETVYDKTGTDYLYSRYFISGMFIINGQAEIAEKSMPVTSAAREITRSLKTTSSITHRPEGVAAPGAGPPSMITPVNMDTINKGVQQVRTGLVAGFPDPLAPARPPDAVYLPAEQMMFDVSVRPVTPGTTRAAIEHLLSTPRGKLFVYSGKGDVSKGDLLLQSPTRFGYPTDVANGPKPRVFAITESSGDARTLYCNFQIETCLNHAFDNGTGGISALLSNRFSQRHIIKENQFLTIETEGDAVFNMERVNAEGFSPDSLRVNLFLPVPFGFVRTGIDVTAYPDGSGVHYIFQDVEQEVHQTAAPYIGASKVECVFRQVINTDTDLLKGVLATYERGLGILVNNKFAKEPEERRRRKKKKKTPPPPPAAP